MPFEPLITNEDINLLPEIELSGEIVVVDSLAMLNQLVPELILETIWGFDTETKPNFIKGNPNPNTVSLLQLSGVEKTYIFRLKKIGLPEILRHILSNSKILKVGVAVRDDIIALKKVKSFNHDGFIDLQKEAEKFNITDKALRKLAAIVLNQRICKSQQLSNWESDHLTDKQLSYAAVDAWVCRKIYIKFQNEIYDRETDQL